MSSADAAVVLTHLHGWLGRGRGGGDQDWGLDVGRKEDRDWNRTMFRREVHWLERHPRPPGFNNLAALDL